MLVSMRGGLVSPDLGEPGMVFTPVDRIAMADRAAPIELEDRTIHVWGFSLDGSAAVVEQCQGSLSDAEQARAGRFIHHQDRVRYVLAHGGLRGVLSRYAGLNPAALTFQAGPTGKPALLDGQRLPHSLRFNMSHSHGRMLVAVAKHFEVGADLEKMRDKVEVGKLADRFYAPSEREKVAALSGLEQAHRFYRYWVAKEAVLKGQGVGLLSLQQCEIVAADHVARAEAHLLKGTSMQPGWSIHWLDCGPGWAGAVSAHESDWIIRVMTNEAS
jgi:4'-phosphopantetheinyl transferase